MRKGIGHVIFFLKRVSSWLPTTAAANDVRGRAASVIPHGPSLKIKSDKDPTDPDDPIKEFLNPNVAYALGPRISTWDEDQKVWLQKKS